MLAIQGIYNGSQIVPLEAMPTNKKYKIIITFVELGRLDSSELKLFQSIFKKLVDEDPSV
jgi:hypothetical protein